MKIFKLFHRHNWTYYNYTPHSKDNPGGAEYRICEKCNKKQNKW